MKNLSFRYPFARLVVCVGLVAVLLVGCTSKSRMDYYSKDIACEDLGQGWSMPDATGRLRSPADLEGKVSYVFFGFTSCPDVCPTTMTELMQVKRLMGSHGDDLQVVFVTVDPERDTPAVADTYVKAFDPDALALVGNEGQLKQMASQFKAFYEKQSGPSDGSYTMSHTAGGYIIDKKGKVRLFAPYGTSIEHLFSDVQRLQLEPGHPAPGSGPLALCPKRAQASAVGKSLAAK